MHAWKAIQNSINYIEDHYDEDINIDKLADFAHLSPFYYQRLFNRLTGKTVGEYIRLRRLAKAADMIKLTNLKLMEIAVACGFQNQSHFTRAFKETYAITPDEYRKKNYHLDHFLKPDLSLRYTLVDTNVPLISEDMILEIDIKTNDENVIFEGISVKSPIIKLGQSKVNKLVELWDTMEFKEGDIGVEILTLSDDPEYFNFFVGRQTNNKETKRELRIMPAGTYAVCKYEAENFDKLVNVALMKASSYLYDVYLPNHKMQPDPMIVQKYFNPKSNDCFIELWAKIKQ